MTLGEKIETLILSRNSGKLGGWLGSTALVYGQVQISNVIYKVYRNINTLSTAPFWTVYNLNEQTAVNTFDLHGNNQNKWSIASILESDFKKGSLIEIEEQYRKALYNLK